MPGAGPWRDGRVGGEEDRLGAGKIVLTTKMDRAGGAGWKWAKHGRFIDSANVRNRGRFIGHRGSGVRKVDHFRNERKHLPLQASFHFPRLRREEISTETIDLTPRKRGKLNNSMRMCVRGSWILD